MPTPTTAWITRNLPQVVIGLTTLAVGLLEATLALDPYLALITVFVAVAFATATVLSRTLPSASLGIIWVTCAMQLVIGIPITLAQLSVVAIAFGVARWGNTITVWLSGVSVPLGVIGVVLAGNLSFGFFISQLGLGDLVTIALEIGFPWRIGIALAATVLFGIPWLSGLALRATARARESDATSAEARLETQQAQREAAQAAEIARLQEERSLLALDVHDVVGHSLAVILAQAESAQYLPDDPARLKQTIATIARSARTSLQDVRHVLGGVGPAPSRLEVDVLLDSARAAGFTVVDEESGEPHPLPPELQTVAHRVLQEMITNAIRHGNRRSPVRVSRRWSDHDIEIEVSNAIEGAVGAVDREGAQGVIGMGRRLESVGGQLTLTPPARKGGRFVAVATMPVRARTVAG
ncbi:hypothetical protein BH10ACT7_BH10ACT7_04030 [soil metagenome]